MVMKTKKQAARMSLRDKLLYRRYVKKYHTGFSTGSGPGIKHKYYKP